MSYAVRCACGKTHTVSTADAGSTFRCACGRTVEVPALHVLRASKGERSVSPMLQIQTLFLSGELPGPRRCACCGDGTDHQVRISVVCERAIASGPSAAKLVFSGCLMLFTGVFVFPWLFWIGARESAEPLGSEVSVIVPVFVCETCARGVVTPETVRNVLRATPAYAALLNRYPNALIRRVS